MDYPLVGVCVPSGNAAQHITPGSAVVVLLDHIDAAPGPDHTVVVYLEDNRYGAANLKTFADLVSVAADRMVDHAPTAARQEVAAGDLDVIGVWICRSDHITVIGDGAGVLAGWLGRPVHDTDLRVSWPTPAL